MKNRKNTLFLICLLLFLIPGCNDFDSSSKESANLEETGTPEALTAEMLDNMLIPLHECAKKAKRTADNDEVMITVNCWENLSVLAEFYSEEFPKKGWIPTNQPEDSVSGKAAGKTVKIAFAKENLKAVVSLIELGIDRTSIKIQISKK